MALREELTEAVNDFALHSWGEIPNGNVVPTSDSQGLTFGNTGVHINACVLYADIHRSTEMVDTLTDTQSAETYKAFLHVAAKLIRRNNGTISAYDGDRVMAVYMGEACCEEAVETAFELRWAVQSIINPAFAEMTRRPLVHTVGIDYGSLLVCKVGVRVDSDLVWVGPAANYAAKLNSFAGLDSEYSTRVTTAVYAKLPDRLVRSTTSGELFWEGEYNQFKPNQEHKHYRSSAYVAVP